MKLFSVKAIEEYYNPPELEVLDEWLDNNSYGEFKSSEMEERTNFLVKTKETIRIAYEESEEYIIAMGLWYLSNKYPDAPKDKIFVFAYEISNYINDFAYVQYGTYHRWELEGGKLIISLAGGVTTYDGFQFALPDYYVNTEDEKLLEDFTRKVLPYLEQYYFQSKKETIIKIIDEIDTGITADLILFLASTEEQRIKIYNRLLSLMEKGNDEEIKEALLDIVNNKYNWES